MNFVDRLKAQEEYNKQVDMHRKFMLTALAVRNVEHRHLRDPNMLPINCVRADVDELRNICFCPSRSLLLS